MAEDAEEGPPTTRRWLLKGLGLLTLAIAAWLLVWHALFVLLLTFAGVLLAIFLRALSDPLARVTGMHPLLSLSLVLLGLIGTSVGVGVFLAEPIGEQIEELTEQVPTAVEQLRAEAEEHPWTRALLPDAQEEEEMLQDLVGRAGGWVTTTVEGVFYLFIIGFVGIYGAFAPRMYVEGMVALIPRSDRDRARDILQEIGSTLRWWLIGRFVSMAVVGLLVGLGLWALGVPLPLANALLAALLDFIPNLGPVIAAVPPILLALMQSPESALWVVLLFIVVQQIESLVVTPLVQQKAVHLPPILTVFVQVLMGIWGGILGVAMATPMAAVALVLVRRLWVEDTLGDVPPEEPPPEDLPPLDAASRA